MTQDSKERKATMIVRLYGIAFCMSIIFFLILIILGQKQKVTNFLLLFMAITISNFGYYSICTAYSLERAVSANCLVYLGGVFVPILLFLSIAGLCQQKVRGLLVLSLLAFASVILYYVFRIGSDTEFYSRVELVTRGGISFLKKEYGPMHTLYPVFVFLCMALCIRVLTVSFFRQKRISYKVILSLFIAQMFSIGVYVGERMLHSETEWMVFVYLLDEILILVLIRRIGMYEVADHIANALKEHSTYGYLVFDRKHNYLGCNEKVKEYLPEVSELRVDYRIGKENAFLYDNVELRLQQAGREDYYIVRGEKELHCSVRTLYHGAQKKKVGLMVEIQDDTQRRQYVRLLNHYNTELENAVQEKTEHIGKMQDKILLGVADMIESRDSSTGGHVKRTSEVVRIFTGKLEEFGIPYGFSKDFFAYVAKAAPMHDLGKITVDDRILRKPGKFTQEEFEEMKNHAGRGGEIVARVLCGVEDETFIQIAENMAHYHHEKWDGSGYPDHLSGIGIPLEARIMALADVFDALVSKRCYKESMDYDTAFHIIEESLGSHFDPELGKVFIECREHLTEYYDREFVS